VVPERRLQILTYGKKIAAGLPEMSHYFDDLLARFTESQHEPRLGQEIAVEHLGLPKKVE
jgi:hypothetical protein